MPATAAERKFPLILACLAALLLIAGLCYLPGLNGGFLFDDFVNLNALGKRGPIDDWPAFWRYITSGTADPTGRPLAMLSFLIDARDWPADPYPFLRTNLILHLLNGILLYLLLQRLEYALEGDKSSSQAVSLFAGGLWLLHPLFVSTTLYVVQREAMLPATFSLLGLILYVDGRVRYAASDGLDGAWRMWIGIGAGTALAVLSKANGILLPLLAATLVLTVLPHDTERLSKNARGRLYRHDLVLLVLPAIVIFAYLGHYLPHAFDDLRHRSWTIGERLLTEPRVLVEYLYLLLIPRSISTGLFNDEYPASTSLLQPATTLPSLLLVLALLATAWRQRRVWPRLSAALLFFFAGHLLESTVVPLELYFEHRNYLPAMLLFWPVASAIARWKRPLVWRTIVAGALLLLFAFTTWQRATLWGESDRLAQLWARQNPHSARAQANAALAMIRLGEHEHAAQTILPLWRAAPGEVQLAFNYVNARCAMGGLSREDVRAVEDSLRLSEGNDLLMHQWLSRSLQVAVSNDCPGMDLGALQSWIDAARGNPDLMRSGKADQTIQPLLGELAAYRGQPDAALAHFETALRSHVNPDFAARMIAFLATQGFYTQALALLDTYEGLEGNRAKPRLGMARLHELVLEHQAFWPREFGELRRKLREEIDSANGAPGGDSAEREQEKKQ